VAHIQGDSLEYSSDQEQFTKYPILRDDRMSKYLMKKDYWLRYLFFY